MQQIGIHGIGGLALFVRRHGNMVFFCKFQQLGAGCQIPFPPRGDDLNVRIMGHIAQFKAHLIIPLARGPMGHSAGAHLMGNVNLPFGNQGAGNGCAQQIHPFVQRIGPKHGEHVIFDKGFAQILNKNLRDAHGGGFGAGGFNFILLPQIGGEGHNLAILLNLQPFGNDGCIESPRIRQHNFGFHTIILLFP